MCLDTVLLTAADLVAVGLMGTGCACMILAGTLTGSVGLAWDGFAGGWCGNGKCDGGLYVLGFGVGTDNRLGHWNGNGCTSCHSVGMVI